jgi:hypothetical protein
MDSMHSRRNARSSVRTLHFSYKRVQIPIHHNTRCGGLQPIGGIPDYATYVAFVQFVLVKTEKCIGQGLDRLPQKY